MLETPPIATGSPTGRPVSRRLVFVLALACGLSAANLYYAQPLLDTLARQFDTTSDTIGIVATLTQVGYAAGLLLLVPLGDLVERRQLVTVVLVGTTLALVGAALAPSVGVLAACALAFGTTSVVAQILVPFAATLAGDAERGRVVGTVMSGLLLGILLARTVSGLIAELAGWRSVYALAAAAMLGLALLLRGELPVLRPPSDLRYRALLRSVATLVRDEPVLRRRATYGSLVFAAFSVFWTSAAFLLARPPYGYSDAVIGLFGLVGVAGVLAASAAGRLADAGHARTSTGAFLAAVAGSFALLGWGGTHLLPLLAGIVVLDLGVQGVHITNQSEVYRLHPEARSRLTTVYMTSYFTGGALGSAASAGLYAAHGWGGVCVLGAAIGAVGLLLSAVEWVRPVR